MAVDKYVGFVDTGSGDALPIGSTLYGTCSTAAATAAKVVTMPAFDRLENGVTIHVYFSNSNSTLSPTLNVNNTGAYPIDPATDMFGDRVWSFTFDQANSKWRRNDVEINSDINVTQTKTTTNNTYPILLTNTANKSSTSTEGARFCADTKINPSNGYLVVGKISTDGTNYYEVGAAAEKAIGSVASGNTGLVTGDAVYQALQGVTPSITGDLIYKGAVSANSSLLNVALMQGYTYVASADFTIDSHNIQTGDLLIVNTDGTYSTQSALWAAVDVIQSNLDRMTDTDIDNAIAEAEAA